MLERGPAVCPSTGERGVRTTYLYYLLLVDTPVGTGHACVRPSVRSTGLSSSTIIITSPSIIMRSILVVPSLLAPLSTSILFPRAIHSFAIMSSVRVTDSQQKSLSSFTAAAGSTGRMPISVVGGRTYGLSSSLELMGAAGGRIMKKDIRRLMMSDDRTPFDVSTFRSINKDKLKEILAEYKSREESGMVLIDVRGEEEIMATGKISPVAETLPLPYIQQHRVFTMDEQEFLDNFGFEKPRLDETIIFTCKAGIRSKVACQIAIMEGYSEVINYSGGANEWFSN